MAIDSNRPPFVLYNLDEIVDVFQELLTDTQTLYSSQAIREVFCHHREDIKICLISMLHGQIFCVSYPGIADDFHFLRDNRIFIRTELNLGHAGTMLELRLDALIPCDGGGTYGQCLLQHRLSDPAKIDAAAYKRTASVEGYCEPVKALRRNAQLVITPVQTGVPAIEVYKAFRRASYDTRPVSKRITLTPLS